MSPAPISSRGTQRKKERQKSETAKSPKYHLAARLVGSRVVGRQLSVQIYDAVVHFHVMLLADARVDTCNSTQTSRSAARETQETSN